MRAIGRVYERVRNRRADFCHQTAHTLTTEHGLVVVEDLRVKHMTASAKGTVEQPGNNVRQKAGLNRSIVDKAWGQLHTTLEWHGRKNGCGIIAVPAAYTSQTCSVCGHVAAESRESPSAILLPSLRASSQGRCERRSEHSGPRAEGVWTWRSGRWPPDEASTTRTGSGACRRLNGSPLALAMGRMSIRQNQRPPALRAAVR